MLITFIFKVFIFGQEKAIINKYIFIDDDEKLSSSLKIFIRDELHEFRRLNNIDVGDVIIKKIIGTGGVDLSVMLDRPLYVFPKQFNDVDVTIYAPTSNMLYKNNREVVDLIDENKEVMTMLTSCFTFDEIYNFQIRFKNRLNGREAFLKSNHKSPTYDDQIEGAITYFMENPKHGMAKCGYKERKGDKSYRLKQKANISHAETSKPTKITTCTEAEAVRSAVSQIRNCFKFVQDHRVTLKSRSEGLFQTPILGAVELADPGGVKIKQKRKVNTMTQLDIRKQLDCICRAASTLPSWYHEKMKGSSTLRKGEVLLFELENLRHILTKYQSHLFSMTSQNLFDRTKHTGNICNHTNSTLTIIEKAPSRIPKVWRTDPQNDIYTRVDRILSHLQGLAYYKNLGVTDEVMGICGVDWDAPARCSARKKIISLLGSNKFRIGIFIYRPGGQASNYVVIFKVQFGVSVTHAQVQGCRGEAEHNAPAYWSQRQTKEAVQSMRLLANCSSRLAYAKLNSILPSSIFLHNSWHTYQSKLFRTITSLLNGSDDLDKDTVLILSDLRKLNFGQNGDLDKSKFEIYFKAMDKVVEMKGSGAHEKRHPQGDDAEKTMKVVYTSQFTSLEEVIVATTEYLKNVQKVKEGIDFYVPSTETVRLAFSPTYECRALASVHSGMLTIKLATRKKSARARHAHAHYVAQQKRLYRHRLSEIRVFLESQENEAMIPFKHSFSYYIAMIGIDDKNIINVSYSETPIGATTYNNVQNIASGST